MPVAAMMVHTRVGFGGTQPLFGGEATSTTLLAGGLQVCGIYALAADTLVVRGGQLNEYGTATGVTVRVRSCVDVQFDGAVVSSTIAPDGRLGVGHVTTQAGGFINLDYLRFQPGGSVQLGPNDVLSALKGGGTAKIQSVGGYAGEQFLPSSDGCGIFITLSAVPPAAAAPAAPSPLSADAPHANPIPALCFHQT